ncbi:MAG: four helix bundle protein [Desulfobacteraceae bacterium]|nr:MAG: four helix bundle protein [Desulfobacteraceae bacterium]
MNENLEERTKDFALQIIKLVERLPRTKTTKIIGGQLLKAGTSVGASYRASYRARSREEFIASMGIVERESDQSLYWLELLVAAGLVTQEEVAPLMDEARQLIAVAVSSINTARW